MKNLILFAVGIFVFGTFGFLWLTYFDFESTGGLMFVIVMIPMSSSLSYIYHLEMRNIFYLIAGSCVAFTAIMFRIGPGNIWPIALVINYVMLTALTVIGWVIAGHFQKRKTTTNDDGKEA